MFTCIIPRIDFIGMVDNPTALLLCAVAGSFIMLVYVQTLSHDERDVASLPILFVAFMGTVIGSMLCASAVPVAAAVLTAITVCLIVLYLSGGHSAALHLAWAIAVGVMVARGLVAFVIPLSTVCACFVLLQSERMHCL